VNKRRSKWLWSKATKLAHENFHAAAVPADVVHEMNVKVGAIIEG
jgi:hypothetical protein